MHKSHIQKSRRGLFGATLIGMAVFAAATSAQLLKVPTDSISTTPIEQTSGGKLKLLQPDQIFPNALLTKSSFKNLLEPFSQSPNTEIAQLAEKSMQIINEHVIIVLDLFRLKAAQLTDEFLEALFSVDKVKENLKLFEFKNWFKKQLAATTSGSTVHQFTISDVLTTANGPLAFLKNDIAETERILSLIEAYELGMNVIAEKTIDFISQLGVFDTENGSAMLDSIVESLRTGNNKMSKLTLAAKPRRLSARATYGPSLAEHMKRNALKLYRQAIDSLKEDLFEEMHFLVDAVYKCDKDTVKSLLTKVGLDEIADIVQMDSSPRLSKRERSVFDILKRKREVMEYLFHKYKDEANVIFNRFERQLQPYPSPDDLKLYNEAKQYLHKGVFRYTNFVNSIKLQHAKSRKLLADEVLNTKEVQTNTASSLFTNGLNDAINFLPPLNDAISSEKTPKLRSVKLTNASIDSIQNRMADFFKQLTFSSSSGEGLSHIPVFKQLVSQTKKNIEAQNLNKVGSMIEDAVQSIISSTDGIAKSEVNVDTLRDSVTQLLEKAGFSGSLENITEIALPAKLQEEIAKRRPIETFNKAMSELKNTMLLSNTGDSNDAKGENKPQTDTEVKIDIAKLLADLNTASLVSANSLVARRLQAIDDADDEDDIKTVKEKREKHEKQEKNEKLEKQDTENDTESENFRKMLESKAQVGTESKSASNSNQADFDSSLFYTIPDLSGDHDIEDSLENDSIVKGLFMNIFGILKDYEQAVDTLQTDLVNQSEISQVLYEFLKENDPEYLKKVRDGETVDVTKLKDSREVAATNAVKTIVNAYQTRLESLKSDIMDMVGENSWLAENLGWDNLLFFQRKFEQMVNEISSHGL